MPSACDRERVPILAKLAAVGTVHPTATDEGEQHARPYQFKPLSLPNSRSISLRFL
jgi:hypothetical protein